MNTYKTEGIVLKRINFGEADKIVTLYSKHYGKITCLAKGMRRLTSRKRGNLEIFNKVVFIACKGKGIDIITETESIESFSSLRKDLSKIACAYQFCEMVDKLTAENSEQGEVYDLLCSSLPTLQKADRGNLSVITDIFAGNLLKLLGFWPKEKLFPNNFDITMFIEDIIEKELKSKKFLAKI